MPYGNNNADERRTTMRSLNQLKEVVCQANLDLRRHGLVILTWGNVSGVDRDRGVMVIKPSGIPLHALTPSKMAVMRLPDGEPVGSERWRPSSDAPTHLALYRAFPAIGGIAHTHSPAATAFAQARRAIPCLGTTHADHFFGTIPLTRGLTRVQVEDAYEAETGRAIVAGFRHRDPVACPAVLVAGHGPFTWGPDAVAAVENSVALEAVAAMAIDTLALNPATKPLPAVLREKHYFRKHGDGAYYGQQLKETNKERR